MVGSDKKQIYNIIECIINFQGHPRSLFQYQSKARMQLYYQFATLVLSCIISEIPQLSVREVIVMLDLFILIQHQTVMDRL